jgi:hypothetical protein
MRDIHDRSIPLITPMKDGLATLSFHANGELLACFPSALRFELVLELPRAPPGYCRLTPSPTIKIPTVTGFVAPEVGHEILPPEELGLRTWAMISL